MFILYVSDQARARDFWRMVLDTPPSLDVPGMTEFPLTESSSLGLWPEANARALIGDKLPDPASARGVPRCELYLYVDDPAAALERLAQAGGILISPLAPRPWGDLAGYGADPDGNVVAAAKRQ